uniref:RRM domain-containing protein n=1 Tax=Gossypium raimondii TaxID=29730 RepID=A0A0D2SP05_GOSRA|nr:hypothetical protein B456_007G335300 [Gossypium raimondii]
MAAVADNSGEAAVANGNNNLVVETSKSESKEFNVQKLVDMFTKLNPLAKEFFPSSYHHNPTKTGDFNQAPVNKQGNENFPNGRRRNNYNQGRRKLNGKAFRAQRDDSIKRTVYVSDIDQTITEEQLAGLFSNCGQVVDCRVCGDPHSVLRFAFVEFADEEGARTALNLGGTMLGFYPVRVLPSKTAILPVNPTFLPRVWMNNFLALSCFGFPLFHFHITEYLLEFLFIYIFSSLTLENHDNYNCSPKMKGKCVPERFIVQILTRR